MQFYAVEFVTERTSLSDSVRARGVRFIPSPRMPDTENRMSGDMGECRVRNPRHPTRSRPCVTFITSHHVIV